MHEEDLSRKRRRRRTAAPATGASSTRKRSIPLVQDVSFQLMHSAKQSPNRRHVHILLHLMRREQGISSRAGMLRWQGQMLHDEEGWRRFPRRTLTFRQLQTPAEDAILGIDSTGSYAVALGGYSEREDEPLCFQDHGLFIRLYGLPSKARAIPYSWSPTGAPVSPLLHTVPVSYVVDDLWLHEMGFPAVLATSILLHRDGALGAAKVGSLKSVPSNHPYAKIDDVITFFPLPRRKNRARLVVRTLNLGKRSTNLDLYLFSSNAVTSLSRTCDTQRTVPCKILIVHHGSIMRFCWIHTFGEVGVPMGKAMILGGKSKSTTAGNNLKSECIQLDIGKVRQSGDADAPWETKVYDIAECKEAPSGSGGYFDDFDSITMLPTIEDQSDLNIFFELQFDAFFICLEVRRLIQSEMGLSPECRKENTCNVFVCTHDDCRNVELIVSFLVNPNGCTSRVAAFVTIDLHTSHLEVMKWVFKTPHEHADRWISSLRSLRLGEIREHSPSWSFLEQIDIEAARTRQFWKLKSDAAETDTLDNISPELDQVDVIDNLDVLRHVPVETFSHPMSPTRIVYSDSATGRA